MTALVRLGAKVVSVDLDTALAEHQQARVLRNDTGRDQSATVVRVRLRDKVASVDLDTLFVWL